METIAIEDFVAPGQKILWAHRPRLWKYLVNFREFWIGLGFGLMFFVVLGLIEWISPDRLLSWKAYLILPIVLVTVTVMLIWRLLVHAKISYVLTSEHIFIRRGILGMTHSAIRISELSHVEVVQDFVHEWLGTGCIRFYSGRSQPDALGFWGNTMYQWESVETPQKVFQMIIQLSKVRTDIG